MLIDYFLVLHLFSPSTSIVYYTCSIWISSFMVLCFLARIYYYMLNWWCSENPHLFWPNPSFWHMMFYLCSIMRLAAPSLCSVVCLSSVLITPFFNIWTPSFIMPAFTFQSKDCYILIRNFNGYIVLFLGSIYSQCSWLLLGSKHSGGNEQYSSSLLHNKYIAFNVEITWLNYTFDINHQPVFTHLISFKWCRWEIFDCYWFTSPAVQSIF